MVRYISALSNIFLDYASDNNVLLRAHISHNVSSSAIYCCVILTAVPEVGLKRVRVNCSRYCTDKLVNSDCSSFTYSAAVLSSDTEEYKEIVIDEDFARRKGCAMPELVNLLDDPDVLTHLKVRPASKLN